MRDEIGVVNSGISLSIGVLQMALSMRSQYILEMAQTYRAQFEDFVAITEAPRTRHDPVVYALMADLRVLHMPRVSVEDLKSLIQGPTCTSAFCRTIVGSLVQSVGALETMVNLRNSLVSHFPALNDDEKVHCYFGLKTPQGFIDDRYPNSIEGMISNSEDVAYFAELLIEKLSEHGEKLASEYGRGAPRIGKVDLTDARTAGRLANRSNYPDFERKFRRPPGDIRLH